MGLKLKDIFSDIKPHQCHENDCMVNLKSSVKNEEFTPYSAEYFRDEIVKQSDGQKICDCIIFNKNENKVTLVELKGRRGKRGLLEGSKKAGKIDDVRQQFEDSLYILCKILRCLEKTKIYIQIVLFTKGLIKNHSENEKLKKQMCGITGLGIINKKCGDILPDNYLQIDIDKILCEN